MCGIAGYIGGEAIPGHRVSATLDMLRQRGPDMSGRIGWTNTGQFFGIDQAYSNDALCQTVFLHTRLSIIDLSEAGKQPMSDGKGRWIIFNGEIYNYKEIRAELIRLGYSFHSRTDTEVILAAYSQWGQSCVNRFNGMWAFALYDKLSGQLFCSRDRLGVKPFHFARTASGGFAFASEIPALLALLDKPAQIDPSRLAAYCVYSSIDDGPETLYEGVYELRGGHNGVLDLNSGQWTENEYWHLSDSPDFIYSDAEALDTFSELFEDAVRLRLNSDVPVSLLLSGGIDSSAIALATKRVGGNLLSVTSNFPESPEIDETEYAKTVAAHCAMTHELVLPNISDAVAEEPSLTRAQGAPYGSMSLYVHWAILRAIKERHIPVVLSGQGGDELFFGYERYYSAYWRSLAPDYWAMLRAWDAMSRHSRLGHIKAGQFLVYFGMNALQWKIRQRRARQAYVPTLLDKSPAFPTRLASERRLLQRMELKSRTLPRLLRYDDRTSGSMAIETRLPFLDYRVVEFAHRLPWHHTMRDGWTKYILRRYLDRHGMPEVAWRTHKLGFNAPTTKWMADLYSVRWSKLRASDFAQKLIHSDVKVEKLHDSVRWDIYNICHLALLHNWRLAL